MARRKLQEVDASSIADIAFILLAFIIIATTLEKESGLPAVLPQKRDVEVPPIKANERNILEILVNSKDQLMIEKEWDKKLEDIKGVVKTFMSNPNDLDNMPVMVSVTKAQCRNEIARLQNDLALSRDLVQKGIIKDQISQWQGKLNATVLVGDYRTINPGATIAIQYDKGTSYGQYLGVRDEIMSGLNELRDELAVKKFGISYAALEKIRAEVKTDEDKAKIKAIREVYPQKIIKLAAKNNAN